MAWDVDAYRQFEYKKDPAWARVSDRAMAENQANATRQHDASCVENIDAGRSSSMQSSSANSGVVIGGLSEELRGHGTRHRSPPPEEERHARVVRADIADCDHVTDGKALRQGDARAEAIGFHARGPE